MRLSTAASVQSVHAMYGQSGGGAAQSWLRETSKPRPEVSRRKATGYTSGIKGSSPVSHAHLGHRDLGFTSHTHSDSRTSMRLAPAPFLPASRLPRYCRTNCCCHSARDPTTKSATKRAALPVPFLLLLSELELLLSEPVLLLLLLFPLLPAAQGAAKRAAEVRCRRRSSPACMVLWFHTPGTWLAAGRAGGDKTAGWSHRARESLHFEAVRMPSRRLLSQP